MPPRGVQSRIASATSATGFTGSEREFWWDDLERLLLLPGRLPERLRLRIGPILHEWHLGEAAEYGEATGRLHEDWNIEMTHDPTPRHRAYRDLCRLLRGITAEERLRALDALSAMSHVAAAGRSTHRALSSDGLVRLIDGGVVDVGAHSVTHSTLSALPIAAQRSEIAQSRARLREITRREVTSFAYPFGGRTDYGSSTVALVRQAGFGSACSNRPGRVRRQTDLFQLPRVLVRDWDADTFVSHLREWLGP